MHLESPVEIDFVPIVPPSLRQKIVKNLKGCARIIISEVVGESKSTRKVNSIKLTVQRSGFPKESIDEIVETATAIMETHWSRAMAMRRDEDDGAGGEDFCTDALDFLVICEMSGKGRKRVQFTYSYAGGGDDEYAEETMSFEERSVLRVCEAQERALAQAYGVIQDSHERLLDVVKANSEASNAGAEIMKNAIPLFLSGTQQVLNARALEYSHAKAEAESKASTEKFSAAVKNIAPFLNLIVQQKLGLDPMQRMSNQQSETEENEMQDAENQPVKNPLAELGSLFGDSLSAAQRKHLNDTLLRKEVRLFDAIFTAKTDAEAH